MAEFLSAKEIQDYMSRGIFSIEFDTMPRLTDEARELLQKVDFEIKLKNRASGPTAGKALKPSPPPAPQKQPFNQVLKGNRPLVGTFLQIGHPLVTEFVGKLGLDFVLIDSEHSAISIETIQAMLQSLSASPTYAVVRIPVIGPDHIARTLDAGADALLIPQVRTRADMEVIRAAAFFPPKGNRGIGCGRSSDFCLDLPALKSEIKNDPAVIIQIETAEAVNQLDQILAPDWFDMVFIGPGDLSLDYGVFGDFANPLLRERIDHIIQMARRYQKRVGIFAPDSEAAAEWIRKGLDLVAVTSELNMIGQTIKQIVTRLAVI